MRHFLLKLCVALAVVMVPSACFAEVKTLAKGDYTSNSMKIQQFVGTINLDEADNSMPFTLNFENGRFQWVRVFLTDSAGAQVAVNAQPRGMMIVNENSFKSRPSVSIDMTGRMRRGTTTLLIRGAGVPGSTFKWNLATVTGMRISLIEPKVVQAGGSITISGAGFSPVEAQNSITFNQTKAKITDATEDSIKADVPDALTAGKYSVQVTANGVKSNAVVVEILGIPDVTGMSQQCQKSTMPMQIFGKNFSTDPKEDEVTIGGQRAEVTSATADTLSITVPMFPDAGGGLWFNPPLALPVTVKVGRVTAKTKQSLYIGPYQW